MTYLIILGDLISFFMIGDIPVGSNSFMNCKEKKQAKASQAIPTGKKLKNKLYRKCPTRFVRPDLLPMSLVNIPYNNLSDSVIIMQMIIPNTNGPLLESVYFTDIKTKKACSANCRADSNTPLQLNNANANYKTYSTRANFSMLRVSGR